MIQKPFSFWSLWEGFFEETFVRRPAVSPRLIRVCDLKLEMWYVSHSASTRVQHSVNWPSKNGNNCICVYSPKSDARWGFNMWMIVAISNRTTVDSIEASLHPGLGIAGRQFGSVDLVPDINFPWLVKQVVHAGSHDGEIHRYRHQALPSGKEKIAWWWVQCLTFCNTLLQICKKSIAKCIQPYPWNYIRQGLSHFLFSLWNEFPEHSLTNVLSVPQTVSKFRVNHFSCIKSIHLSRPPSCTDNCGDLL